MAAVEAALYDWDLFARPSQKVPEGDWSTWVLLMGRGAGKTRTLSETARHWVRAGFNLVNVMGATADDVRSILIEGESGILTICPHDERPEFLPSKRMLRWPGGAVSLIFSADEPERLRGHQHQKFICDELMAWRYPEAALDMARFGLRLGTRPQMVIASTPKPSKLLRQLIDAPGTVVSRGTSFENASNLAPQFFAQIVAKYESTRLGRQELLAEVLQDNPGALWTLANIDANRARCRHCQNALTVVKAEHKFAVGCAACKTLLALRRIVVAMDPSATETEESDECGTLVVGADYQNPSHVYVLEDLSAIMSPDTWGRTAVRAYHRWQADRIVAEANNGGDMVGTIIRHVDPNVSFKKVHASRGKVARAEPIGAIYEQNRGHHVGAFPQLEDQLTDYNPATSTDSPDRMDTLVWGVTELLEGGHGLIELWLQQAHEAREAAISQPARETLTDAQKRTAEFKVDGPKLVGKTDMADPPTDVCPKCGNQFLAKQREDMYTVNWQCICGLKGQDKQVQKLTGRR
jgi:phage terminase large subunit-like protein